MFSKGESKRLREDFWISFGKSFPEKWILYDTKIKGLVFRFHFDLKKTMVSMDVDHSDLEVRIALWEKITSLKTILKDDFIPDAIFEDYFILENGKEISRVFVEKTRVSIHNKNTWQETMIFLSTHMKSMEDFFHEYEAILRS